MVEEPGHASNPASDHREDEKPGRARDRPLALRQVAAIGGLGIGAGAHQPEATLAPPRGAGAQKGRHRLWAVVLVRRWRHGQPRVVGEQGNDAVDIACGEGGGEPAGEIALGG